MAEPNLSWGRRHIATVAQLAGRYGLSVNAMHKALGQPGAPTPIEPPPVDKRTPTRYVTDVDRYMGRRPGKGANLRGHG